MYYEHFRLGACPRTQVLVPLLQTEAAEHVFPSFVRTRQRTSEKFSSTTELTYYSLPHFARLFVFTLLQLLHFLNEL